jgi:arylamine N-acetyltransferase
MAYEDHWLPGFNFNVEEWFESDRYETLAICRTLALARARSQLRSKRSPPAGSRTRVVQRHPKGDW